MTGRTKGEDGKVRDGGIGIDGRRNRDEWTRREERRHGGRRAWGGGIGIDGRRNRDEQTRRQGRCGEGKNGGWKGKGQWDIYE